MIDTLLYYPFILLARRRAKKILGIENIPQKKPVLLVVNHIDYLDGWLLTLLVAPKIKRKLYFISQTKNYFWTRGITIPVEKYGQKGVLKKALNYLRRGRIIVLFPEGKRNQERELLKGKTGAARLALWSKCPVVPIGIIGPSTFSFWSAILQAIFRSRKVTINIGPAIDLSEYYDREITYELLTDCTRKIMKAIGKIAHKTYFY